MRRIPGSEDRFEAEAPGHRVEFTIRFSDDQYVIDELTIKAPRVTAALVRSISLTDLLREAVAMVVKPATVTPATIRTTVTIPTPADAAEGPTDKALQAVALIYRDAKLRGEHPTRAVEKTLELSYRTAGRWAMKAREKGYL